MNDSYSHASFLMATPANIAWVVCCQHVELTAPLHMWEFVVNYTPNEDPPHVAACSSCYTKLTVQQGGALALSPASKGSELKEAAYMLDILPAPVEMSGKLYSKVYIKLQK